MEPHVSRSLALWWVQHGQRSEGSKDCPARHARWAWIPGAAATQARPHGRTPHAALRLRTRPLQRQAAHSWGQARHSCALAVHSSGWAGAAQGQACHLNSGRWHGGVERCAPSRPTLWGRRWAGCSLARADDAGCCRASFHPILTQPEGAPT